MKAVLKLLLVPLALIVLFTQCEKDPEPVHIPDDAFLNALIELGVDKNGDGEICPCEAKDITFLDLRDNSISDLTGIEAFINLDTLICRSMDYERTNLSILDVSKNTALKYLGCSYGKLTSLDVSKNTALVELHCWGNQLTSLDVSSNTELTWLDCGSNQLTTLDVSHNTALEDFCCSGNPLNSLDISNNTALESLDCTDTKLSSLDVSNNSALHFLSCYGNQITSLDFTNNPEFLVLGCSDNLLTNLELSNCPALWGLRCNNNQLTSLDISNNAALAEVFLRDMPTLEEVCVWEMPFPPYGVSVDTEGSPNVYFTTECSK